MSSIMICRHESNNPVTIVTVGTTTNPIPLFIRRIIGQITTSQRFNHIVDTDSLTTILFNTLIIFIAIINLPLVISPDGLHSSAVLVCISRQHLYFLCCARHIGIQAFAIPFVNNFTNCRSFNIICAIPYQCVVAQPNAEIAIGNSSDFSILPSLVTCKYIVIGDHIEIEADEATATLSPFIIYSSVFFTSKSGIIIKPS